MPPLPIITFPESLQSADRFNRDSLKSPIIAKIDTTKPKIIAL